MIWSQVYQERAKELAQAGDEEARLDALRKWIQTAEQSEDPAALAQAHMQMGLAYQQQVLVVGHFRRSCAMHSPHTKEHQ